MVPQKHTESGIRSKTLTIPEPEPSKAAVLMASFIEFKSQSLKLKFYDCRVLLMNYASLMSIMYS